MCMWWPEALETMALLPTVVREKDGEGATCQIVREKDGEETGTGKAAGHQACEAGILACGAVSMCTWWPERRKLWPFCQML